MFSTYEVHSFLWIPLWTLKGKELLRCVYEGVKMSEPCAYNFIDDDTQE